MKDKRIPVWSWILGTVALFSLGFNVYYFRKKKNNTIQVPSVSLSNQEEKVLNLILDNKTNKEIATALFISVSTVKTHINNIYKQLDVSSRDEVKKLGTK
jgi:DNA-binding CsgD family transcriptional regulator